LTQQLITLGAALLGALFGLFVPLVTSATTRRERDYAIQVEVASKILEIFNSGDTLTSLLRPDQSLARRNLYLLALRLKNEEIRNSCLNLVSIAGDPQRTSSELEDAWYRMTDLIGRLYRHRNHVGG
jgi:hypothetical protein